MANETVTQKPMVDELTLFKTIEENCPNWIIARNKQEAADLYQRMWRIYLQGGA